MRLPLILLIVSAAAFLGGGALIGLPALGACLMVEALVTAGWALLHDDGADPIVAQVPSTVRQVLERYRDAA